MIVSNYSSLLKVGRLLIFIYLHLYNGIEIFASIYNELLLSSPPRLLSVFVWSVPQWVPVVSPLEFQYSVLDYP